MFNEPCTNHRESLYENSSHPEMNLLYWPETTKNVLSSFEKDSISYATQNECLRIKIKLTLV